MIYIHQIHQASELYDMITSFSLYLFISEEVVFFFLCFVALELISV